MALSPSLGLFNKKKKFDFESKSESKMGQDGLKAKFDSNTQSPERKFDVFCIYCIYLILQL